jgi:hypothetical protein
VALPAANEPLKLADGTLVYPDKRVVTPSGKAHIAGGEDLRRESSERMVAVPTHYEARKLIINAKRRITDLPETPKTMNTVNVVLLYSMYGLDDFDISVATGLTEHQVGQIKMLDAFQQMRQSLIDTVLTAELDDLRQMLQQKARMALNEQLRLLEDGKQEVRFAAAKDILDRAGMRPVDVVEHRHKMEGGLRIIVEERNADNTPMVDITPL